MTSKKHLFLIFKNISLIIIGTIFLAFGMAVFIIPFDLVSGGMTGIAIIINKLIPTISIELTVTILTWVLFFMGIIILGRHFALKTLISTIIYPVVLSIFLKLLSPDILDGFFMLEKTEYSEISIILASLFGGVFAGSGCALTFLGGGSTGGVDILAFSICKFFKKAKSSVVLFILDAATIFLGMFVLKDLVISLLGISTAFISATVIDKVFLGASRGFVAQVITDKWKEINKEVINKLKRTTTIFDVTGGFSQKSKKLIMISFTMTEYAELIEIISAFDDNAFIAIQRVHEINGLGWTK